MTKKEISRLVRLARERGSFKVSATEREFFCPLDMEAKRAAHDRTIAHRFTVYHLAWESPDSVAAVTKALLEHIDPDAEACVHATKGQ